MLLPLEVDRARARSMLPSYTPGVQQSNAHATTKSRDGNQTLARGLRVLLAIADSKDGLSVLQVADLLAVHRSIAYRLLQTLVDFRLVVHTSDGAYVPGARMATLAEAYLPRLRDASQPVMRKLANELQSTVLLFVEQSQEAVAIMMVEPTTASQHLAFRPGMRTPLTLGAAGYALLASGPPASSEPDQVRIAREVGYAKSHAEVEAGQYAVAAWIPRDHGTPPACLNLITFREAIVRDAGPVVRRAADEVFESLRSSG